MESAAEAECKRDRREHGDREVVIQMEWLVQFRERRGERTEERGVLA